MSMIASAATPIPGSVCTPRTAGALPGSPHPTTKNALHRPIVTEPPDAAVLRIRMAPVRRLALPLLLAAVAARADQSLPAGQRCGDPRCETWEGRFTDDYPGDAYTRIEVCRDGDR